MKLRAYDYQLLAKLVSHAIYDLEQNVQQPKRFLMEGLARDDLSILKAMLPDLYAEADRLLEEANHG